MGQHSTYIIRGNNKDLDKVLKQRGYKPLTDPPKEGKKRVTRKDRYENDRIGIDILEIEHDW